jgi:arylsulfatase A-like enzyme
MAIRAGKALWPVLLAVLVLVLAGTSLMVRWNRPDRPNVLWISMDSLRADHLGCYGYARAHTPHIDGLAGEGVRFQQCVSQASYTRISVPSMITGKYPFFLNMRMLHGDLDTAHVTVAEAMAAAGYFTCAIAEPWPAGFYQGVEVVDVQDRGTTKKTRRCLEILEALDDRPFFIWLYYWDPHAPYQPPDRYLEIIDRAALGPAGFTTEKRRLPAVRGSNLLLLSQLNRGAITLTEAQRDQLVRLYDAEIAFVDAGIGQVTAALKRMGLWDDTLVLLSADHGEAFGEHGLYYHSHSLYEEEVRVPFIIKPPRSRAPAQEIPGLVRNMDMPMTILDYCGIAEPEDVQGRSLRPFIESGEVPRLPSCLETHSAQKKRHLMAYRTADHKIIYQLSPVAAELYDLQADPGEQTDLLKSGPAGDDRFGEPPAMDDPASGGPLRARELEEILRADMLAALGAGSLEELEPGPATGMDPQTREQLKALGYIE